MHKHIQKALRAMRSGRGSDISREANDFCAALLHERDVPGVESAAGSRRLIQRRRCFLAMPDMLSECGGVSLRCVRDGKSQSQRPTTSAAFAATSAAYHLRHSICACDVLMHVHMHMHMCVCACVCV